MNAINSFKNIYLWVLIFLVPLTFIFPYACNGGSISGTITVDPTGEPIEGIKIEVGNFIDVSGYGWSDTTGKYMVDNLAEGDYFVWTWNEQGYVNEAYQNIIYCEFLPPIGWTAVHVDSPSNTPDINLALAKAEGSMSGSVVSDLTGAPIEGVTVTACGSCSCKDTCSRSR